MLEGWEKILIGTSPLWLGDTIHKKTYDACSEFDGHVLGVAHHGRLPIPPVPPPVPLPAHGLLSVWN